MSNRSDYRELAEELQTQFGLTHEAKERVETELHNAHVAGQEGSGCGCRTCFCSSEAQEDQARVRGIRQKQDDILACLQRVWGREDPNAHIGTLERMADDSFEFLKQLGRELVALEDAQVIARMRRRRPVDMKAIVAEDRDLEK